MEEIIKPRRIYHGDLGGGQAGIHIFKNELIGVGASTTRHCHPHDHWTMPLPIVGGVPAKFRVRAFYPGEPPVDVPLDDDWPMILIEAGVDHEVTLTEGDRGLFMCIWSHYQKIGDQVYYFADPKGDGRPIQVLSAAGLVR